MTSSPRVSAVITAFNSAVYIRDAIESVLAQTRKVDEILVVDDGSVDSTPQIAVGYAEYGVRYVRQENKGAGAARNFGLKNTCGDWVAYLDADDIWMKKKTEIQLDFLSKHPEVGVISGQKVRLKTMGEIKTRKLDVYGDVPESKMGRELLFNNIVGNPSMALIRRSLIERLGGYNPNLRWGQDWELWIRLSAVTRFGFVDEPVIEYRTHGDNLTHQDPMKRLDCLLGISQSGIRSLAPLWMRPILNLRALSQTDYFRALHAIKKPMARKYQIAYALASFLFYPWDRSGTKFRTLIRAVIGEDYYQGIRNRFAG